MTGQSWVGESIPKGWIAFTPDYANLTEGAGTNVGYYVRIGKTVFVKTRWVFGASAAVGTQPTLTLPVTASANAMTADYTPVGQCIILDSTTAVYIGVVRYKTTTTVEPVLQAAGGTNVTAGAVSATAPMTWTTNDELNMFITYEAA